MIKFIKRILAFNFDVAHYNVQLSGLLSFLGHPLYWMLWTYIFPHYYDNFYIRFSAAIMGILLVLHNHWPDYLKKYKALYWYLFVIYILPFIFTYLGLKNSFSQVWITCFVMMMFFVLLFSYHILISISQLFIGILSGVLLFLYKNNDFILLAIHIEIFITFIFVFCAGVLFVYYGRLGVSDYAQRQRNQALKSLSGSIAHELRNPFNSIKIAANNLASKKDPSINDIGKLNNQVNQLINFANNIIDMNLSEISGKEITKDQFNYYYVKNILIDTISLYGYRNKSEIKKLILKIEDKEINKDYIDKYNNIKDILSNLSNSSNFIILSHYASIQYIMFNLIKNALYYVNLPEYKDSTITISYNKNIPSSNYKKQLRYPKYNNYNIISVYDMGAGIKDDIIDKIFNPYFTYGKRGGTGLGLDFCKRMMAKFDGEIIVESIYEEWTRFTLLFPPLSNNELQKAKEEITQREEDKKETNRYKILRNKQKSTIVKKIFIIDDSYTNLLVISKELKSQFPHISIDSEMLPKLALSKIIEKYNNDEIYDLILTDLMMPELNGIELTSKIREEIPNDMPILIYSSRKDSKLIQEAINSGANDYLIKSSSIQYISANISKWLITPYMPLYYLKDTSLSNINIIFIDDIKINRMLMKKLFSDTSANLITLDSPKEVIELFKQDPYKYHIIITDINMPEMSGQELALSIREYEEIFKTQNPNYISRIIFSYSGESDHDIIRSLIKNNFDHYIIKSNLDKEEIISLCLFYIKYKLNIPVNEIEVKQNINEIESSHDKNMDNSNILDKSIIKSYSLKERKEILQNFVKESQLLLSDIKNSKNNNQIFIATHALKGTSRILGSIKLFNYLETITNITKKGLKPKDRNYISKIEKLLKQFIKELYK